MQGPTLDELLAVLAPAGGAGATADDVAGALAAHVIGRVLPDASAAGGPRVSFANGVWVDASLSLKAAFAEITSSAYKAEIQSVNFQTKPGIVPRDPCGDSRVAVEPCVLLRFLNAQPFHCHRLVRDRFVSAHLNCGQDTLFDLLESGVMKRSLATLLSGGRRQCSFWKWVEG